jgi:hypothetical protein
MRITRYFYKLAVSAFFIVSCFSSFSQKEEAFQSDLLTKKWVTPRDFDVPESVCFDATRNVFYVSNIGGNPSKKDNNGFISKCSPDGKILTLKWVTGFNAPKGMGIFNNKLFVADIDRVAEIDIEKGTLVKFHNIPGARFLNDIAVDSQGNIYISDTEGLKIYKIGPGGIELWLDDKILTAANGLFVEGNTLLIGCNKIVKADIPTRKIEVWLDNTGNIDGLEGMGDGRYLFSDWKGSIYIVGKDKKIEKILDTSKQQIMAADINYIPSKKLLFVPTFFDNRVFAYKLK